MASAGTAAKLLARAAISGRRLIAARSPRCFTTSTPARSDQLFVVRLSTFYLAFLLMILMVSVE
jgi:hypothetical protein